MQQSHNLSDNDCIFCGEEQGNGLAVMMGQALTAKHASNQSDNLIAYVDVIMKLEQPCNPFETWAAYEYKQALIDDEQEEFMKRQYEQSEFNGKINMLTEYYKFHSDVPRVIEPKIQRILGKHYDKKREFDYKKIKRILKEEQGLSISSVQESQSSMNGDSNIEKKSRYSTMLDVLQQSKVNEEHHMSDSKLLKDMCKVIEKALPSSKHDNLFEIKGSFSQDRYFQDFIKRQEGRYKPKVKDRYRETDQRNNRRLNLQNLLKRRGQKENQKSRERDSNVRDSRQTKRRQKDNKQVYNTNIKIQIKNAMFYSHGQQPPFNIANIEYDSATKNDNKFKKKSLINQVNYLNHESNKKLVSEIYKSSQHDLKKRMQNSSSRQRMTTKESMNRSQSKNRKNSLSRQSQSTKELKKGTSGSASARKVVYANNQWVVTNSNNNSNSNSKPPSRNTSASNLKRRSFSTNAVQGVQSQTISAASLARRNQKIIQKRPIESISKYGSSDINAMNLGGPNLADREKRAVSIKQLLNRKLTIRRQA